MGVLDCEDKRHAAGCSKHYVGHGHSAHRCGSHDFRPPDGRSVRHDTPISIELGCLSKLRVRVTHTGKPITYLGFRGACCRPFWGHCRSLRKLRQGEAPCAGLRSAAQACVEGSNRFLPPGLKKALSARDFADAGALLPGSSFGGDFEIITKRKTSLLRSSVVLRDSGCQH